MAPLDVRSPIYNQSAGLFATVINSRQIQEQTGLYLQDQIEIDKFILTLGFRHDWANLRTENNATGVERKQSDEPNSYRAGLVYLFDNGLAPYASYSTSFEPTVGVDEDGAPFRPTTARQFEVGVKYQPDSTPLLITASAFDIEQDDTLTPGSRPGFSVQAGQISSQGIEFEVRGNVSENLELIASATWLDTAVNASSNPAVVGKRPQAVPEQFASAWASYRIPSGALSGLHVGSGIRYVSESYGDDLNTIRSPAYTVVDLALRYDLGEWISSLQGAELTLNVSNLLDREYYISCSFNIYCQFGNRREVLAGLRHTW